MIQENNGKWKHGFFPYTQGYVLNGHEHEAINESFNKWSHVEACFKRHDFKGLEARTILYLIDENSVDIGDYGAFKEKVNTETNIDIFKPEFFRDPLFYRQRADGLLEYNQVSRIRLQELNKSVILANTLGIDNIKMDAAINELMVKKPYQPSVEPFILGVTFF